MTANDTEAKSAKPNLIAKAEARKSTENCVRKHSLNENIRKNSFSISSQSIQMVFHLLLMRH